MQEIKLFGGERQVVKPSTAFVKVLQGKVEVYMRTIDEADYQQIFLLEGRSGDYIFPATDISDTLEVVIFAELETHIAVYEKETGVLQDSEELNNLQDGIRTWFKKLTSLLWIRLLIDKKDDMLGQWEDVDFLCKHLDWSTLMNTLNDHQAILTMLVEAKFRGNIKTIIRKNQQYKSQQKKSMSLALSHLLGSGKEHAVEALQMQNDSAIGDLVCRVAAFFKMPQEHIRLSDDIAKKLDSLGLLRRLIHKAGMQIRLVKLGKDWFKADAGVLIAYYGEKKELVALLPQTPGCYYLYGAGNSGGIPVTETVAKAIAEDGFVCYPGLPTRMLKIVDLLKFIANRIWKKDIYGILLGSIIAGLVTLCMPIVTTSIFSDIIPIQDYQALGTVTQVMMIAGFTTAAVSLVRSVAVLRIKNSVDMMTESAIWSRLISLPLPFFRRFQSGDIVERMNGLTVVTSLFGGNVISGVFNTLFSFWSLILMCYYSVKLTGAAVAIWIAYLLVITFIYRRELRFQRKLVEATNETSGQVLQLINGLNKIRLQGAEEQAFFLWAKLFAKQWNWKLKLRWQNNYGTLLNALQPMLLTLALYYGAVTWLGAENQQVISYAEFMGFQAAFTSLNVAIIGMIPLCVQFFSVTPYIENLKPILETVPEVTEDKMDADELTGRIEMNNVSFTYNKGETDIIKDVSLLIKAGESVAFVGKSGCGKSTLVRLLIGFEKPRKGGVYYDGQDIADLNISSVRRQMGVVLQNGQLMSGDIFTNIVGTLPLTMEEAWEAAKMVGLDKDIEQMPMGMYTMISEGGGNISGGQRQRVLLARSLVHRPKIVIMDEATSALDNTTQGIVTKSLAAMHCTRIIVAHRLSTIQNVDRIIVLDAGEIIEEGSFAELMNQNGVFAKLVKRQLE